MDEFSGINVEKCKILSVSMLIKKCSVSKKKRELAQNYLVIKRIYGFSSVPCPITNVQAELLHKYGFDFLPNTSFLQMDKELKILEELANGENASAADKLLSDEIFEIRVRELKYLYATNYFPPQGEIYDGYKALEKFIQYIGD